MKRAASATPSGTKPSLPATLATSTITATPEVTERIRARAYELYEQRGRVDGFAEQDWLQAEIEFLSRNALAA